MNPKVTERHAIIMCLSYALACKYMESQLGMTADFWSTKFGREAVAKLYSDEFSPNQLEELCAGVLNFGEKLPE